MDLKEVVRYLQMGNERAAKNRLQEIIDFERACAAMISYRQRLATAEAEDEKYRSLVTHNISATIEAIEKRSTKIGLHLRESIESGREFWYDGSRSWDVSY